ncbi:MAG: GNAT family N-acetyltransferase [Aurantibacter sp.]
MPITETKRLRIDRATPTDASFFLRLMNNPNWIRYIGDRGVVSEEHALEHIKSNLIKSYEEHGYGLYKMSLKSSDLPIGICGFVKRDYLDHADIGFAVLPEYEGKGFVFEAAQAVMAYGKNALKLNPILAITSRDNIRSKKLLLKIGLKEKSTVTPPNDNEELLLFSNE